MTETSKTVLAQEEKRENPRPDGGAIPTTVVDHSALPEYVQLYLNGTSMQDIAADLGVHRATLYRHMLRDLGNLHEDVVSDMLITRIAEADEKLDSASDACDIARARERARFARMDYERRRPHLYGQRPQTQIAIGDGVTVNLVSFDRSKVPTTGTADRIIDGDADK